MTERPERPPTERREVVERREVIDRPADPTSPPRRDPGPRDPRPSTAWLWIIPLLVLVIFLVWFILSRGDPQSPLQGVELDVPSPQIQPPAQEPTRIEIELPDAPPQQPQPQQPEAAPPADP